MDPVVVRDRIVSVRRTTVARLESLRAQFTAIIEGSEWTTDDDEHDPEGSTIAFERAKVVGLARDAEDELRELDEALVRLDSGTYGRCEKCGKQIADARLEALVAARRCIECNRRR
ncbi:TraR/DksA family transcriptional regulator [Rhodococcoides yunnanense]|uniref:TraR/DksA family transcriptional regulator n=1 Tax=Rhodococcoides yunnanense TaxID=278209 RepID=UPI000934F322|nr:TraR/DksA C4-type zinc finger protein [Rhodococcus yunnanensis]